MKPSRDTITLCSPEDARNFYCGLPCLTSDGGLGIAIAVDLEKGIITVRPWRWYDGPLRNIKYWFVHTWLLAVYWYYHAKWLLLGDK